VHTPYALEPLRKAGGEEVREAGQGRRVGKEQAVAAVEGELWRATAPGTSGVLAAEP
jgi:hypothetical protein